MAPNIDHIIVLLSHADLQDLPQWLSSNFTISPGGKHAGGRTENKLIAFRDGSYLELISFINDDPAKRRGHWWGSHTPGFIDWALTSDTPEDAVAAAKRVIEVDTALDVRYAAPIDGGRTRPDGQEVKWKVTFPENARRGEMPFWCHDVTARDVRVPEGDAATSHPCGAVGIAQVTLSAPPEKEGDYRKLYDAALGMKGVEEYGAASWEILAPKDVGMSRSPRIGLETAADGLDEGSRALFVTISDVALLTDSVGIGQSRDTIFEKLGDQDVCIQFIHGRQA